MSYLGEMENKKGKDELSESSSKAEGHSFGLYTAKKTVAQGMMDLAFITANANQLRNVLQYQRSSPTFYFVFTLIVTSIVLQVAVGICLIFKGRFVRKRGEKRNETKSFNDCILVGVFLVTIINVFISAFSIGPEATTPTNT